MESIATHATQERKNPFFNVPYGTPHDTVPFGDIRLEGGLSCDSLIIHIKGGGNLLASGINCKEIRMAAASYGSVRLDGTCTHAAFDLPDKHNLHIEDLQASRLEVNEAQPDTESVRIVEEHKALSPEKLP